MSDSELSDAPSVSLPTDDKIETTLQDEVKKAAKGPLENYTVSKIRKAAESSLDLPDGFFKGDEKWKSLSKKIIEAQVAIENEEAEAEPQSKPPKSKPPMAKPAAKTSTKRNSVGDKSQPRKRQKLESDDETSALSSPPSGSEDDFGKNAKSKSKKVVKSKSKKPVASSSKSKSQSKSEINEEDDEVSHQDGAEGGEDIGNGSGSEMSIVLDEAPPKQARRKSKGADSADKKAKASNPKPKLNTETDPDQEEIKKLQGWLAKCGIRKVWGKELKPFGTSKAKIKHLRDMLADAGMAGRYSNEKAAQIKEARELAADIEAVQEGNERWGKDGDDEEEGDGDKTRSGRRLVRGAKNYDFLSSDGEETD